MKAKLSQAGFSYAIPSGVNIQLCKCSTAVSKRTPILLPSTSCKGRNEYLTEPAKLELCESSFFYQFIVSYSNTH